MPDVDVSLPQDVYAQFDRLVEAEFVTEAEAIEEFLSAGLDAYTRTTCQS